MFVHLHNLFLFVGIWMRVRVWFISLLASVYLFFDSFFVENSQIKWLVDTFRAKIVDISEHSVTIEVINGYIWICFFGVSFLFVCSF